MTPAQMDALLRVAQQAGAGGDPVVTARSDPRSRRDRAGPRGEALVTFRQLVTLRLWTAQYSIRDVDRFDVTRGGCERARAQGKPVPGIVFAPSAELLRSGQHDRAAAAGNEDLEREAWERYAARYRREMLAGYGTKSRRGPHRAAWEALLARDRVVCVCFCGREATAKGRCHRLLLASFLVSLGAEYVGGLAQADAILPEPAPAPSAPIDLTAIIADLSPLGLFPEGR